MAIEAKIKAKDGQSLFDICLMTYGNLEHMYKLLQDNDIDSINETDISQKTFTFDKSSVYDVIQYNNNQYNGTEYATAYNVANQPPSYAADVLDGGLNDNSVYSIIVDGN